MHQKVAMEGVRVMKNSTQDPGKDTNKIRSSNAKNSEEAGHSGNFLQPAKCSGISQWRHGGEIERMDTLRFITSEHLKRQRSDVCGAQVEEPGHKAVE